MPKQPSSKTATASPDADAVAAPDAGSTTAPGPWVQHAHEDELLQFRLLLNQATDMLCRLTPAMDFVYVSAAARSVLGYEPEELVGRNHRELIHPEDHHLAQPAADSSDSDGFTVELRLRRKDSRVIWVQCRTLTLRDEQGEPREIIASLLDVTERKQAQDNLRHSERLASLGTLASGIAHEINNPLGAILLAAHAARELNRQSDQRAMVDQMLEQILMDTRRGARIVRSILQFARQEPTDQIAVRLRDLVLNARMLATRYAGRDKAVEIKVRGPDESPWVLVGAIETEQALLNLLHNAIDAGASRIEVQVRPARATGRVTIQVVDDGKGMTAQEISQAFDPFYTSRSRAGGTGLGLSIAQGIIAAHGGKMALTSSVNHGTTVTFDLPLTDPPGAAPPPPEAHGQAEMAPEAGERAS